MKIIFRHYENTYQTGIVVPDGIMRTLAKLDTGAAKTIIGLKKFSHEYHTQNFISYVQQYAVQNRIEQHKFTVANGEKIYTYPCFFETIYMDGEELTKFRFELILNENSNKFLVGDDFMTYCKILHEIEGDFIFSDFNDGAYKKQDRTNEINICQLIDHYTKNQKQDPKV